MRHGVRTKKLGRTQAHRQATLRNLVRALFIHQRIRTTLAKAKLAQRFAERILAHSSTGTLAARRNVLAMLPDKSVAKRLFDEIVPQLKERTSGYTRILRLGPRPADGAEMAFLELVVRKEKAEEGKKGKETKR